MPAAASGKASNKPVASKAVKKSSHLTLKDRLSRLSYLHAVNLLGPDGKRLLIDGSKFEINIPEHVWLGNDLLRVTFPGEGIGARHGREHAVVTLTLLDTARDRLHWKCDSCDAVCRHIGAVCSMVLESKSELGLAALPELEDLPTEVSDETLIDQALSERRERARAEAMNVASKDKSTPWTDYTVTSKLSGKTYRVALRGFELGVSYCSCPDYRTNTLGTCKHILHVAEKVKKRFTAPILKKPYQRKSISIALRYGAEVELRVLLPQKLDEETQCIIGDLRDQSVENVPDLLKRVRQLQQIEQPVAIYPDAEEFMQERLFEAQMAERVASIRRDPKNHPLRKQLLKTELLPYQLDGIAFVASAGRAVLADEMGLGKTIQGVGVAEFLAREAGIKRVLVICPASLKSQWRNEVHKFSDRSVQLIAGANAERASQYSSSEFFTVCNYEQVLRDITVIEQAHWDLIILDEGQRIKNWEAKTTRIIKGLRSRFALVLSGTPLENRLDELYSVVQFIDDRRLGPGFRFFQQHRIVDEKGKVKGYRNLAALREKLKPILLRRTRVSVQQDLPPRTTEVMKFPPTDEQLIMHNTHLQLVSQIVRKRFLTEMDLLRLQRELQACRMSADSTFLVDKQDPSYSSKLEVLADLIERLFEEDDRKAVLFSEWTTMLDLIEPILKKRKLKFVRLDGSVPQKKRQGLVHEFQTDPNCRMFLTTNAGSTGLNLQAANTVINVDLPWNPAVLEQRIARAYRMGQTRPVDVYILVTEDTLEERLLATLAAKQELANAALDVDSEIDEVTLESGMEELKRRLELLLGARAAAPVDESQRRAEQAVTEQLAQQQRLATAGGALLTSALQFLGEMLPQRPDTEASQQLAESLKQGLANCVQRDESGQIKLTLALPDASVLDRFAESLAKMLAR